MDSCSSSSIASCVHQALREPSFRRVVSGKPKGPWGLGVWTNIDTHILWMDKILHHLETMGNHCLLEFTGESSETRVSKVVQDFVHPQYYGVYVLRFGTRGSQKAQGKVLKA